MAINSKHINFRTLQTLATSRIAMYLMVIVVLAMISIHLAFPDMIGALVNRARYDHRTRLIDTAQYTHTVAIAPPQSSIGQRNILKPSSPAEPIVTSGLRTMANGTSSNIVVVNRDGDLLFEAYHATPTADASMLTNSMSMAKTLVALLIGIAIDNGAIQSVHQPIRDFIPEFNGDLRGEITIKNLLQMESGLGSQNSGFPLTNSQAMYFGSAPHDRALAVEAVRGPGETFEYNSINTQLLLLILERSMQGEFEALLSKHIWAKLNLEPAYTWRASRKGQPKGFCCVFATARTWAALGRVFLCESENDCAKPLIVSPEWLREMMAPSRRHSGYGYQVWLSTTKEGGVRYVTMEGTPMQYVVILPTLGIAAVRVGDEDTRFDIDGFVSAVINLHSKHCEVSSSQAEYNPAEQQITGRSDVAGSL